MSPATERTPGATAATWLTSPPGTAILATQIDAVQAQIAGLEMQLSQFQSTYNSLLSNQRQIDLANAQATSQIRVAEPAVAPRIVVNTVLSGVLGLLIAAGLVALID